MTARELTRVPEGATSDNGIECPCDAPTDRHLTCTPHFDDVDNRP
jgi:hypothetical protein